MGGENRKSDVASLGKKLKFHLLVYIIDMPTSCFRRIGLRLEEATVVGVCLLES